jgi:hypothetical protein
LWRAGPLWIGQSVSVGLRIAAACAALLAASCSPASDDDANSPVESSVETGWTGFEASASSISLHDDGTFDRQLQLLNVPITELSEGVGLAVHPATAGITVWTSELPDGGHLILCSTNIEFSGGQRTCRELKANIREKVDLLGGGGSHQGLVVRGTWPDLAVIAEINISYRAQDDFFAVTVLD